MMQLQRVVNLINQELIKVNLIPLVTSFQLQLKYLFLVSFKLNLFTLFVGHLEEEYLHPFPYYQAAVQE